MALEISSKFSLQQIEMEKKKREKEYKIGNCANIISLLTIIESNRNAFFICNIISRRVWMRKKWPFFLIIYTYTQYFSKWNVN